ncbi:putative aminopeptidase NPEPL1, partial [Araneus ventricosus]
VVCEYKHLLASACAVARSYPGYCKKSAGTSYTVTVEFIVCDSANYSKHLPLTDADISCLQAAADAVRTAGRIVDTPCNEMHTDAFLEEIYKVGEALGIRPEVIRGEELQKRGFGGLYAVGKAAEHPPALAILSHTVRGAKETIAWVGKGIVYDTGGLFIKPRGDRATGYGVALLNTLFAYASQSPMLLKLAPHVGGQSSSQGKNSTA